MDRARSRSRPIRDPAKRNWSKGSPNEPISVIVERGGRVVDRVSLPDAKSAAEFIIRTAREKTRQ